MFRLSENGWRGRSEWYDMAGSLAHRNLRPRPVQIDDEREIYGRMFSAFKQQGQQRSEGLTHEWLSIHGDF